MMVRLAVSMAICMVAAAVFESVSAERISPCPEAFRYTTEDQGNGQWDGTVTLLSDADLHGVWLRLIFDDKLSQLTVANNFGEVVTWDSTEILIKNKDYYLKAGVLTDVKISVKYEGSKVPSLIGYRLNARTVCPVKSNKETDFFMGSISSNGRDFLSAVLSTSKQINNRIQDSFECGKLPSSNSNGPSIQPWHADLYVRNDDKEHRTCEATLITPNHLLTAAHCVTRPQTRLTIPEELLTIHLGEQKVKVARVSVHPGYEVANLFNDVAIVHLATSVKLNDFVRPVCLPQSDDECDKANHQGVIGGYELAANGNSWKEGMLQAAVKEIRADECIKRVPELAPLIGDGVYCAAYLADKAPCVGDSGSGLTSEQTTKTGRWELRGVVTIGMALQNKYVCNQSSTVLVVDVGRYLKWIQTVVINS